ncbi:MAG: hypothetical protein KAX45_07405 [Chitinophagaceae bacterium]|nr:hypothetical protein [Chitinophagaceae bacterium]MBP6590948.1 hypothetical protein [Chitinophagaceae bacterium]MBP8244348.1 hypothetical protein [Chitinophagaceae bacterium]
MLLWKKNKLLPAFLLLTLQGFSQADNEIQVYASPTIQHKWTIFELHSNYTFKGSKNLARPKDAHWTNETLEITHGFGKNFEIGFYTFTGISPTGRFQYLGNQVRPRVTVPASWNWKWGASLSLEFGFFRPDDTTGFFWQGELRPILDKTVGNWYFAFNPNIDFVVNGAEKGVGISPQIKTVYTIKKVGIGFEYYSGLGTFKQILPFQQQEHLLGPMIDLYVDPKWEVNGGFLFGLTRNSNQRVFKLLLGRRRGK